MAADIAHVMTADEMAHHKIATFLASSKKARVYFSRQFYNGTKSIKLSPARAADCLRVHKGKLQLWEGKTSGGWCNVLGYYHITGDK